MGRKSVKEEKILLGIQNRNEKYLDQAIKDYGRLMYALIERFIHNDHAAVEEIVSDVFIELWNNAARIDLTRGSLKNMLCLIARSRALDYLKKNQKLSRNIEYSEEFTMQESSVEETLIEEEKYKELCETIKSLKEPTATIFKMRYFQNESIENIAFKLGMKRDQVDNHLSRGRKKLLQLLESNDIAVFSKIGRR